MKTVIFKVHDCGCVETDDASNWVLIAIGRMIMMSLNEQAEHFILERTQHFLSAGVQDLAPSKECVHVIRPQSN